MKTFNLFSSIAAFVICFISCTQTEKYDCENVLNERLYCSLYHRNDNKDSLKRDHDILMECGNLDSVDAEMFSGPLMTNILTNFHNTERKAGKITYKRGLEIISIFKKEEKDFYKLFYVATATQMELENIKVNSSEFEKIRPKLIKVGMDRDIEPFRVFIEKSKKNWTYGEAMNVFFEKQKKMRAKKNESKKIGISYA